jgi:hypothetical protein
MSAAAGVALTAGLAVVIITVIVYRLAESYLIEPRIIGQAVPAPAVITVVAALPGGALQGIVGALVTIPAPDSANHAAGSGGLVPLGQRRSTCYRRVCLRRQTVAIET